MNAVGVRYGFHLSEKQAVKLQQELNKLERRLKRSWTPADVVREAEDPKSPFHDFFEWDDGRAAVEYRLEQARYIIRAISISLPEYDLKGVPANLNDGEGGYVTTRTAIEKRPDIIAMREKRLREEAKRIASEAKAWKSLLRSAPVRAFVEAAERLAAA